jgi:hypothetical protein
MIILTTESLSIHRLLQAVILSRPDRTGDDVRGLRDTALEWLGGAIPAALWHEHRRMAAAARLVAHAETRASHSRPASSPSL